MTLHSRALVVAFTLWCAGGLPARAAAQQPDPRPAPPQEVQPLPPNVPPLTDADRAAAFPDVPGHASEDNAVNFLVLFDQFEWQTASGTNGLSWDNRGWVGKDTTRLWFRTEGETESGTLSTAQAHLLWGHSFARWWDVVAGVRQDVRPGSPQTWAAIGVQGLAPYWFDIEATAYVGESGRTQARLEIEYEQLVTNRLVLQPLVEVEVSGKEDPERRVGAGLSTVEAGLRLRYEFRREFAPYLGLTWQQKFGATGDFAKADGEDVRSLKLVAGVRWWF